MSWWPRERPVRTIIGFLGIAIGATVAHSVRFDRTAHIPAGGPALVVANHLSTTETLALARLITGHHRFPHFLAKAEVFDWPVVGRVLRTARQIPVLRGTADAATSLDGATAEFERGHLVVIYPEGRLTRTAGPPAGARSVRRGAVGAGEPGGTAHPGRDVGTATRSTAPVPPAPGDAGGRRAT